MKILETDGEIVTTDDIEKSRKERDMLWKKIRPDKVGKPVMAEAKTLSLYENSVKRADETADKRIKNTHLATKIEDCRADIDDKKEKLSEIIKHVQDMEVERKIFDKEWNVEWKSAGFIPKSPSEMAEWLNKHEEILRIWKEKQELGTDIKKMEKNTDDARNRLCEAFAQLKLGDRRQESLKELLDLASERIREHNKMQGGEKEAVRQMKKERNTLQEAQTEKEQLYEKWRQRLKEMGLPDKKDIDAMDEIRDAVTKMRQNKENKCQLDKRVQDIEKDIAEFLEKTQCLLSALAPSDCYSTPKDMSLRLEKILRKELDKQRKKKAADESLTKEEKKYRAYLSDKKTSEDNLEPLLSLANTDDENKLHEAIQRSKKRQDYIRTLLKTEENIIKAAPGKNMESLKNDSAKLPDLDQLNADIDKLNRKTEHLEEERLILAGKEKEAKRQMDEIDGKGKAADFEQDKQLALAEMVNTAEEYVRLKSVSLLLKRIIDKKRHENRGPILEKSANIFKRLTLNGFKNLSVDYDDKDNQQLLGVRMSGEKITISGGMSDGTCDQLYLALRIASLQQRIQDKGLPLPIIADDLFINFDDERARAGFQVLGELAEETQVLFFSHHRHLLDLAKDVFDKDKISVHILDRKVATA